VLRDPEILGAREQEVPAPHDASAARHGGA